MQFLTLLNSFSDRNVETTGAPRGGSRDGDGPEAARVARSEKLR